jgi:hypothetical protein
MLVFDHFRVVFEVYFPAKETDLEQVITEFCDEKAEAEGATQLDDTADGQRVGLMDHQNKKLEERELEDQGIDVKTIAVLA